MEIGNPSSAYSVTISTHHSKSSLPLRGRVSLPLDARRAPELILVFSESNSPSSLAAKAAGAHIIGGEELFPKVLNGEIQPTKVLTTPSMLPAVQRQLARFLGPKGLMPSPKRGGVGEGEELGKRIKEAGGTLEWKADKLGVIRARTSAPSSLFALKNPLADMLSCCKSEYSRTLPVCPLDYCDSRSEEMLTG